MAVRNIVKNGDYALRLTAKEVTEFNKQLDTLLSDMVETMLKADGVGIAANQVGVLKQAVIVSFDDKIYEFINPQILEQSGESDASEGCLSVPGINGNVVRPQKIKVKAKDRRGKEFILDAEDLFARIICHELDHLKGVLFIDKAKDIVRKTD